MFPVGSPPRRPLFDPFFFCEIAGVIVGVAVAAVNAGGRAGDLSRRNPGVR